MKHFILSYRLFENESSVIGLSTFIKTLQEKYPNNDGLFRELSKYIVDSGCPAIKFETIYGAQGISKTDECVINISTLNKNISKALYTILHEIAHQYQYSKYGKDVMWDSYSSNIDIDDAVDILMNIELVADRLSILKTNDLVKRHGIKDAVSVTPFYSMFGKSYFKTHLERLRKEVETKGMTSVEQVNEYMYNKLKIQPKPITYTRYSNSAYGRSEGSSGVPRNTPKKNTFNNQSIIDKVLDKLSAGSWSDLTDQEKGILRSASKK